MSDIRDAIARVLKVADGATINGTYRAMPIAALEAFKVDLKAICAELKASRGGHKFDPYEGLGLAAKE